MVTILIKSVIIFFIIFIVMRIMGKRQLGEMQPFELVITLIIAEVACIPMNDPFIPLYNGIIPIVTLATLHLVFSFLSRKSMRVRKILSGQSVIAIDKNGINYANLKKMNINVNDLLEAIRSAGYFDFNDIDYAIFETNGKLCVLEKKKKDSEPDIALYPLTLFVDGAWEQKNLTRAGLTTESIAKEMEKQEIKKFKDILYIDVRQNGVMYVSPKYKKYFTQQVEVLVGADW